MMTVAKTIAGRISLLASKMTSRLARRSPAGLLQASEHVLHVDDRVVDEAAHCDREAPERHDVDGLAQRVESEKPRRERERKRGQRHESRADVQ
jgi:hypothetical protein